MRLFLSLTVIALRRTWPVKQSQLRWCRPYDSDGSISVFFKIDTIEMKYRRYLDEISAIFSIFVWSQCSFCIDSWKTKLINSTIGLHLNISFHVSIFLLSFALSPFKFQLQFTKNTAQKHNNDKQKQYYVTSSKMADVSFVTDTIT